MPRIPLEDNFNDVIGKAQRGLKLTDAALAAAAGLTPASLAALQAGTWDEPAARTLAPHLRLGADALAVLGRKGWYPEPAVFRGGFAMFNTPYEDITVNAYLIWDEKTRQAAAFDTGATCAEMLELIQSEKLRVESIFLTHTHEDHIADLARLVDATRAPVYVSERESQPGARPFKDGATFHLGGLTIKTLPTWGHSPGGTTYLITGLTRPVAIVGDALFASSMGGSRDAYAEQYRNNVEKILTLPKDTVLACGHGPLTTVGQEKLHNPFFTR